MLPLPAEPEAVIDLLPPRRRDDLRRCARRAAEVGAVTFETADASSRDEFLQEIRRIHALRWEARGEAGVLADTRVAAFHDAATPGLMAAGLLRLHLLRPGAWHATIDSYPVPGRSPLYWGLPSGLTHRHVRL